MKKPFNWIILLPMYFSENKMKKVKVDHQIYLWQQIKAYQFIKLKEKRVINIIYR